MTEEFQIGQRWYSYTEAELGLGVVTELVNRRVVILFPATGEERTYAQSNAPLSRIVYPIGDQISDDEGLTINVTDHEEANSCVVYVGLDADDNEHLIHEASLESSVHFSKPYERLFAGQIDKLRHYELRLETLKLQHQHQQSDAYGLIGPRVQFLPHQFYIASEVGKRIAPRVLLADEVGLGKTIEAGLILHQQLVSGLASRVLIVVPDSLIHQWLVEMLRRFNLHFSIMDQGRCDDAECNPFESVQLALSPISLFTREDKYLEQAVAAGWDLMVVDEAHHLGWSEEGASHAYQSVEALARQVKGLLLLTATPEQLGIESHFARLRLLDPDRYYDLEKFKTEEQEFQRVNQLIETLKDPEQWDDALSDSEFTALLHQYLGDEIADELEAHKGDDSEAREQLIDETVKALLDQHGTGRVLFRNTRDSVEGFPQRLLHSYELPLPEAYASLISEAAMEQQLHPETLVSPDGGSEWLLEDNRADWMIQWLEGYRSEKILVICAHAHTAIALEKQLRLFEGKRTALFHEGMSLLERDRAAAYFADSEQGAQLLICSEIGSEGRNFQFAHHMVMFDLPLNPDLLEQRIGRLDRIGQAHDVNIHVPYFRNSAQEVLLRWYKEGLGAFEQVCPTGQNLMQQYAAQLHQCMENPLDQAAVDQLVSDTAHTQQALLDELQKGRDRLLELNSCDETQADLLHEALDEISQPGVLASYMGRVFDHFGVEQETTGINGVILHPSDHMLSSHFPGLPSDGMTATFQRNEALSREDMHFLSWEHPMVSGSMEMMLEGSYGSSSLCTMKLLPLKAGSLLVEGIFRVHCVAERSLQLQRYLSEACVRRVIDSTGNDLTGVITEQHFATLGKRVGKNIAYNLVKHAREDISNLVVKLEQQVEELETSMLQEARQKLEEQQNTEKHRLVNLAKVNPNIRQEEIDAIDAQTEKLLSALSSASLKMDAVRVAVITHE
ncbi:RNA polymerase-associated protein RapA [Neptuniibacter sp.]|uniref:RNA polymerase-associated protein RapA n=1 Tax=Neptuniibacter sp. TaxID=1962643 RepID=UPI00263617A4|nr:RNA polymerase-associated protein RapA [Neptuniibacter sp.]MCP4596734.1 RNA polymerase-associated protein RapA [Neptuniibacter sp.]